MASLLRAAVIVLVGLAVALPVNARFARLPAERVDEVPVERLLANLRRNAQKLPPAALWRAIGRVHLLAYLRNSRKLPVYRANKAKVAEGEVGDCAEMDGKSIGAPMRDPFPVRRPGELCEARDYTLGPDSEIPPTAHERFRTPSQHLRAAINAYTFAKEWEPENFRTRLALAFAFDRASRLDEARAELRFVVQRGLRRTARLPWYQVDTLDWDTHAVLSEAVDHFGRLAVDGADRQDVATLRRRLKEAPPHRLVTPILVPLEPRAAFDDLVEPQARVRFDFTAQGPRRRMGWVKAKAAWLVWDPKRKGKITSGSQLFGSVTWLAFWDNGFHALGSLDDDGDGKIAGRELEGLALWRDLNLNGVSERGEVKPVTTYGIVALSYAHERVRGDLWLSRAGVTFADGETRPTYDWVVRPAPVLLGSRR